MSDTIQIAVEEIKKIEEQIEVLRNKQKEIANSISLSERIGFQKPPVQTVMGKNLTEEEKYLLRFIQPIPCV